ncbi:MAG: hypothetical protein ACRD5H_14450, partial [Nitrososphaerales archaeon]
LRDEDTSTICDEDTSTICVDTNDARSWHLYQSYLIRFRTRRYALPRFADRVGKALAARAPFRGGETLGTVD